MNARARLGASFLPLGVLLAPSCGPVDLPPPSVVPTNACPCPTGDAAVDLPRCKDGYCALPAIDPVLVFDFTDSSSVTPTLQYGVRYSDLGTAASCSAQGSCAGEERQLGAAVSESVGYYAANPAMQQGVSASLLEQGETGPSLGEASVPHTVPVHTHFCPAWPLGSGAAIRYVDAASLGLPLRTVSAGVTSPTINVLGGSPIRGPGNAPAIGWSAGFYPGAYTRLVSPDRPYDTGYPPLVFPPTPFTIASQYVQPVGSLDPPDARSLTVARAGTEPSLEGWTVQVRDPATLDRLSQLVTLHDGALTFDVNTAGQTSIANRQLVIAPPDGSVAIPTLVDNVPPTGGFLKTETYPALPPPARVTGTVRGPSSELVDADVLFVDTAATTGSIATIDPSDPARAFLHYRARARASAGAFDLLLPPGAYDVVIVPDATTLAVTPTTVDVGSLGSSIVLPPLTLRVVARVGVRGLAVTPDGRPLARATVEARPSVALLGTDPERWPRASITTADDAGAYAFALDPGTYDILVEPVEGSGYPWTLLAARALAGDRVDLGTTRTPYPNALDFTLVKGQQRVERVLVRAYLPMPRPGAGNVDGGPSSAAASAADPPFVQVGQTLVGSDGRVQLFLTMPN